MESLAKECQVVRLFNQTVPEPLENRTDAKETNHLAQCLDSLQINPDDQRIGFIGATFARQNSLFVNETEESLNLQVATNIRLYLSVVSQLLPRMVKAKYGHSVYLSSFRTDSPVKGTTLYAVSKAFGETFFSGLGKEYGRFKCECFINPNGIF